MAGVEGLLASVLNKLGGKAFDAIWNQIASQHNLKDDVERLRRRLLRIQEALPSAEMRSLKEGKVSSWLKELKATAYDMEDIIDAYESRRGWLDTSRLNTPKEVKGMIEKVKELTEQMSLLNILGDRTDNHHQRDRWVTGSSLPNIVVPVGRDDDKKRMMDILLRDVTNSIIPVYGFGGVGKTTLAQMVFNDETVRGYFNLRAWVYVSMEFDLIAVGKNIITDNIESPQDIRNDSLECVQNQVKNILTDKQFLIVLDGLWEQNQGKLEKLKGMLTDGLPGSKVIVTTRSVKVAALMNPYMLPFKLHGLSDEDCWKLFQQVMPRSEQIDDKKKQIGKEIIQKCHGIPLAVKSIGYILSQKNSSNEWEKVRDSDLWAADENDDEVLPSLKLSYYHMPSDLKACFAYCSIFPQGFHMEKSSLVQQWIALGLCEEDRAGKLIEHLLDMSFLQTTNTPTSIHTRYTGSSNELFWMHDLAHKLARLVARDELLVVNGDKPREQNLHFELDKCRYMLLANFSGSAPVYNSIPRKARSLHFKNCSRVNSSLQSISEAEFLRVLDFSTCTFGDLHAPIDKLKLLTFLNMSGMRVLNRSENTDLVKLPSYICKLLKLQYLDLHGWSNLKELPEDIHLLKELQHLNLSKCTSLQSLPSNFGGLQKLSFLSVSHCHELDELPDSFSYLLNMVDLNVSGCHQLKLLPDGLFKHMKKLRILNFSGCTALEALPEFTEDVTAGWELKVLDLSGCANLRVLPNSCTKLSTIQCLNLSGCSQLQNILKWISHWKFSNLEYLNLSGVGAKGDSGSPSTSTEVESSQDPDKELELGMLHENISSGSLPLKYLSVGGFTLYSEQGITRMADFLTLPNFDVCLQDDGWRSNILLLQQILDPTHHELNIKCLENVVLPEEAKQLELDRKPQFHSLSFEWSFISGAGSSVEDERRVKPSEVLDKLMPHSSLKSLSIRGYICTAFPDWVNKINDTLPNLVKLVLSDMKGCDYIPANGHLPNLQELEINDMPRLHDARIGPCKKLRRLTLVALPEGATVNFFHDVQIEESSHGCDEEMRRTGQEFNTLPEHSLPGNQVTRNPSEMLCGGTFIQKLKVRWEALWSSASERQRGGFQKERQRGELSRSSHVPEAASAAYPELDFLKIERCNNLILQPSLPKSKEYFIKDSSLSHNRHAMHQLVCPTRPSKMNIEGRSGYHFLGWLKLVETYLDELVITDYTSDCLDNILSLGPNFRGIRSMADIYDMPRRYEDNLEKINLWPLSDDQNELVEQNADNIMQVFVDVDRHDRAVSYVNIGTVAFLSVERLQWHSSSNISLLYKHHDARSSRLVIANLENVGSRDEVKELANYHQLRSVRLVWSRTSSDLTEDSSVDQDEAVLQNLRPHHDLETLEIEGYGGDEFCSWVMKMNYSLPNLVIVKLSNIAKCQRLPPLGQLANLEVLHISGMPNVKEVDRHVYGKLRELKLSGMNVEEWPTTTLTAAHDEHQLSQGDEVFPNLQVLAIVNCPRLRLVPAFPGTRECTLVKSSSTLVSFEQFIRSSNLALITLEIIDSGSSSDILKFLQGCVNLEHLTIDSCIDLITLPEHIRKFCPLKKLQIRNCWNFSELPEWLGELKSLEVLEVQATKLKCLPQSIQSMTALKRLVLEKCNYKLQARCISGEDKDKIQHIETFDTTKIPFLFIGSSDIMLLQRVTCSQFIELHIGGLEHAFYISEVENLDLRTEKELTSLSLEWRYASGERGMQNKAVLEKFQPHDGLEILRIKNYAGFDFPQWMSSLQNLLTLEMDGTQFQHLHLDQLQNLRHLYLSNVEFEHILLNQLQNLEELHLSQIAGLGSSQPACIECSQPLRKLQKIVMSEINNQELKISMPGGEGDEDLFPGLQHLEMVVCENLRFQPSIPRSAKYIISGIIELDQFHTRRILGSFLFPLFKQVMGMSIPGSTSRMEIKNTSGLSSERWESIPHLELLNITELTIDNCVIDSCPLPKCILGWKSLRKLEIRRCENIESLPEWLGEMPCLTELIVETYWMEALHPCIRRLTNLQSLTLITCLNRFKERCKSGDDWINIKHIPHIQITDRNGRTEIISPSCT